ncbi:MAG: 5-deoxy-glucuronate isomerase [Deinococcales bacterium]
MNQQYYHRLPKANGIQHVPNHGCALLDFHKLNLYAGQSYSGELAPDREALLVMLSGKARVVVKESEFSSIGGRTNVFAGNPHSLYIPRGSNYEIHALSDIEAALPSAPSSLDIAPYEIKPEQVNTGTWGKLNFTRYFREILVAPNGLPASSLIVGETITPSGNWSTYPPHKHELVQGSEVFHEEIYYFRVSSPDGFGLCRHYSPERGYDTTHTVRDDSFISLPHGYHTYAAAPGAQSYYLWFLAGDARVQGVSFDPETAWVQKATVLL